MKKYELTEETRIEKGVTLHRIRAVKDFTLVDGTTVHAGDLGGWIEKETNLSHDSSAWVSGEAWVSGQARVFDQAHYLCVGPVGSRNGFTTFFRTENLEIYVSCGCFLGDINAFRGKVKETHGDSKHAKVHLMLADLAEAQIDLKEATP